MSIQASIEPAPRAADLLAKVMLRIASVVHRIDATVTLPPHY